MKTASGLWLVWAACSAPEPIEPPALQPTTVAQPLPEAEPAPPPKPEPLPEPSEPRYAATHILIAWEGAVGAAPTVRLDEIGALLLAEQLRALVQTGRNNIEELARKYSDDPSAGRGGRLGVYLTGTFDPEFERVVASLAPGELGPSVRTPFGWHVVRRDPVVQAVAQHLVVAFGAAPGEAGGRSHAEAMERIAQAKAALAEGEPFEAVARRLSDDGSAARGGHLGPVAPGQLIPAVESALFALEPGQVSEVVQTPTGLHLIRRIE